jgi:uncharacterized protein (DUF608 family)
MVFVVIETYYKHGEYKMETFDDIYSLNEYLLSKLEEYGEKLTEWKEIDLIQNVVAIGNWRVENEEGWGVREVREI